MLNAFRSFMQQGGGGLLLPEMMLVLFAMGILLTDYLLEARDKYFNALMAMLGVIFSAICLWQLRLVCRPGQRLDSAVRFWWTLSSCFSDLFSCLRRRW